MKERLGDLRSRAREGALRQGFNPRDADLLLTDVLGEPLSYVLAHGDALVDAEPLEVLLARRAAGEPVQYIRGRTEFYGREFAVDERVLIPRPETELLVEAALGRAPRGAHVVDVGTGSGCIAVTLAAERPDLHVIGLDASVDALAVARRNGARHAPLVRFAASDLLGSVRRRFDVVVSNPPYIPAADVEELEHQVRAHEPRMALTPGPAGTEAIERIYAGARGAIVLLEIGFGQELAVRELAARGGQVVERVIDDLAGIPRIVVSSPA